MYYTGKFCFRDDEQDVVYYFQYYILILVNKVFLELFKMYSISLILQNAEHERKLKGTSISLLTKN